LFRLVELEKELQPNIINPETGFPVDVVYETDVVKMDDKFEKGNSKIGEHGEYLVVNEQPNGGKIFIDGVDISTVDLHKFFLIFF
jgi:hypothetical protein